MYASCVALQDAWIGYSSTAPVFQAVFIGAAAVTVTVEVALCCRGKRGVASVAEAPRSMSEKRVPIVLPSQSWYLKA